MIDCAVVLAGGEGKRMKDSNGTVPKPFVKVNNKPLIHYIIDALTCNGITKIIIIEPYFYSLKKDLKQAYPKIRFHFYKPRKKQNVIENLLKIKHLIKEKFILADSDIIINNNDIKRFIKNQEILKTFGSIAVVKNPKFENNHYLEINKKKLVSFNKNGTEKGTHGGFVYSFNKKLFKYLKIYKKTGNSSFSNFINYLTEKEYILANFINDVWDVDDAIAKDKTEKLLSRVK